MQSKKKAGLPASAPVRLAHVGSTKFCLTFPKGTAYRSVLAGFDAAGRSVRFCWSCQRNRAGHFVGWQQRGTSLGASAPVQRGQFVARTSRKELKSYQIACAAQFARQHGHSHERVKALFFQTVPSTRTRSRGTILEVGNWHAFEHYLPSIIAGECGRQWLPAASSGRAP